MLWCTVAGMWKALVEPASTHEVSASATGVSSVYSVSQATAGASNIFAVKTAQWVTAFFASTLATNLLSSGKFIRFPGLITSSQIQWNARHPRI